MAKSRTLPSGSPRDTHAAEAAPRGVKVVGGGGTMRVAHKGKKMKAVLNFMGQLSDFEKRSSKVNFLVR